MTRRCASDVECVEAHQSLALANGRRRRRQQTRRIAERATRQLLAQLAAHGARLEQRRIVVSMKRREQRTALVDADATTAAAAAASAPPALQQCDVAARRFTLLLHIVRVRHRAHDAPRQAHGPGQVDVREERLRRHFDEAAQVVVRRDGARQTDVREKFGCMRHLVALLLVLEARAARQPRRRRRRLLLVGRIYARCRRRLALVRQHERPLGRRCCCRCRRRRRRLDARWCRPELCERRRRRHR